MPSRTLLLSGLLCLVALASPAAEPKTVRLLTVGNSFSANATRYLGDLAKAGGHTLIHQPLVLPGASFQDQVAKARKHEEAPKSKSGLYANGLGLKEALRKETWDYVTIQQASIKSADFRTYQPYAGWLRNYIAKHAPQANLLIHQTWAYRIDDPRFLKPSGKEGEPQSHEQMYRDLTSAYDRVSAELGGTIIPVGDAFYAADTDPAWGFKHDKGFDRMTAKAPALPDQTHSLHVGWQWKKQQSGKLALVMDGHHANRAGEYLGGCVWYEVLFGESAVGSSFIPKGMAPDDTRFLQETAHKAVQARASRRN
jgi:hypothetical protein